MKFSKMLAAITQVLNQDSDTQVDVCMTSEMARRIELWTAMYEDNAPWMDRKKVKSAQLPAAIASEVARLVTLEMKSEITGGSSATYLNDQYQKKVLTSIRRYVEYGCAKGGLILKPYVTKTGLAIQYVQADCFFPLAFDDYLRNSSGRDRRSIPGWKSIRCRENRSESQTGPLLQPMTTALEARSA